MRLVTRADLDGLTCSVIISENEDIDGILLVSPQDITDARVKILPTDILANVPYHPQSAKWFDHHPHTATPAAPAGGFEGAFGPAPSAARLVYDYYGGEEKMPHFAELVRETDRVDSADLTPEDITNPQGYVQLGFTVDSRSGLGAIDEYFLALVDLLGRNIPIEQILDYPEVKERCERLRWEDESFRDVLMENSRVDGNVVITDLRSVDPLPVGNRFLIYALYPEVNVSLRLQWDEDRKHAMLKLGHSIFNRTCKTDLGELAARYGGGGHAGAASLPLIDDPDQEIRLIVAELKARG